MVKVVRTSFLYIMSRCLTLRTMKNEAKIRLNKVPGSRDIAAGNWVVENKCQALVRTPELVQANLLASRFRVCPSLATTHHTC
jgi:hypothetical protein